MIALKYLMRFLDMQILEEEAKQEICTALFVSVLVCVALASSILLKIHLHFALTIMILR